MTARPTAFQTYLEKAAGATWTEPLWYAVLEFFASERIGIVIYHHLPPLGAPDEGRVRVVAHGVPQEWLRTYISNKHFRIDPIPEYAMRGTDPVKWSGIRAAISPDPEQRAVLALADTLVPGDGLAVPTFGPGGRNGYFGLGFGEAAREVSEVGRCEYQAVCQSAHLKYCALLRDSLPPPPQLSRRELEILEWVARGKSNTVIADIVGISTHTVDAYLRRVFVKLGTTDRTTAAIRGLGTGVIRGYVT